jgi:Flp pilus assembly protein TadD
MYAHAKPSAQAMQVRNEAAFVDAIDQIVAVSRTALAKLPDFVRAEAELLATGETLADLKGMTHDDCEAAYSAAVTLFDQGRLDDASAVSMLLAVHAPNDPRFSLAAGMCHERLGRHEIAVPMFALSHLAEPSASTLLRLAASLSATGKTAEALRCFEEVESVAVPGKDDDIAAEAVRLARALRSGEGDVA